MLTLLSFQGQKLDEQDLSAAIAHIDLGEEPSESDTDSLSTPTESPSHRTAQQGRHTVNDTPRERDLQLVGY